MIRIVLGKKIELKMVAYLLQRAGSLVGCCYDELLMKSIHSMAHSWGEGRGREKGKEYVIKDVKLQRGRDVSQLDRTARTRNRAPRWYPGLGHTMGSFELV